MGAHPHEDARQDGDHSIIRAMDCTKTLQMRIKDKHASVRCERAREVNQVWNHVNAIFELRAGSFSEDSRGRWYRSHEQRLGIAQRARKKKCARAIHAKVKNLRKDELHPFGSAPVKTNAAIFVGDVASAKLVKTKMAKSTLDAGWAMLKTMLEYKSDQAGIVFEVVERKPHNPDLFVLRGHSRQQSER